MHRIILATLLLLTPYLGFGAAVPVLTVNKATINYGANQVTFSGSCFEPAKKAPTVLFNGSPLTVASYTNTQIVATLPANATAGTYAIIVANSLGEFNNFDLTYGAAGPQGSMGLPGANGAQGPAGPQGPQGPAGPDRAVRAFANVCGIAPAIGRTRGAEPSGEPSARYGQFNRSAESRDVPDQRRGGN